VTHICILEAVPRELKGKNVTTDIQVLSPFQSSWRAVKWDVVMKTCLYGAKELEILALFWGGWGGTVWKWK